MAQDATIIGRTLAGRFRVTGVIGEGGMATVYRAVQDAEPKDVAIKVMNPELAKDSRFVRRFRREAKAASMLKHPNTVSILEFGVDQGFVFLAMECLEGNDLALLLHRERRVPEARAANIVMQVCKALAAAHDLSIVHRDLKPDNIMIVKQPKPGEIEHVKVLDFGIAKILDEDEKGGGGADPRAEPVTAAKSLLTRVGTIVGTPAYMAPEQGRAEPVDGRTDVYACGVLLYELVTGRVPFSGETPMQVVMRHVNEPPQPPSTFLPIQPDLEAIIMRSLSKWPAERQQSATELAESLGRLLPHLAEQKRQVGDAIPGKVIINDAKAPAPAAEAPVVAPPVDSADGSTLVMEAGPPAGAPVAPKAAPGVPPKSAAPATVAPSFPTLNIDVPEDIMAGIDAKPAPPPAVPAAPARAAPPPVAVPVPPAPGATRPEPKLPANAFQAPRKPAPEPVEPDADSDDVRTLIAREAPVAAPAAPAPPPQAPPDSGDDDPRTVVAPPRGASIPDLSQPIAFSGVVAAEPSRGLPAALGAPPTVAAARAPTPGAQRLPTGPVPPSAMAPALADSSTTLVSAVPDPDVSTNAKSSGPKLPGTTPLKALKGTAKMEPVEIPVAVNSTLAPETQPSAVASIGLDETLRIDPGEAPKAPAPPRAEKKAPAGAPEGAAEAPPPPSVEIKLEEQSTPIEVAELEKPRGPAPAVWEPPQRKRMSGPMAMGVGILIGAILFGLTLLILHGRL